MDIGVLHSWPPQTGSPDTERCTASRVHPGAYPRDMPRLFVAVWPPALRAREWAGKRQLAPEALSESGEINMNLPRIAHPFVFVLVFSLAATGLWAAAAEEEPAAAMEKEMVLDPRTVSVR